MTTLLKFLTSATGVLGFAAALIYLWLVYMAFQPAGEWAVEFLVGPSDRDFRYAFLMVLIPYVLLVAHLYLRTHLGGWLVDRGEPKQALDYSLPKIRPSLLRSHKECVYHRIAAARAHIVLMEYPEAYALLSVGGASKKAPIGAELGRWSFEAALRLEDLESLTALQAREWPAIRGEKPGALAALWACKAEAAVLLGDRAGYLEAERQVDWYDSDCTRLGFSRALAQNRWGMYPDDGEIASQLEAAGPQLDGEVPGRAQEVAHILETLRESETIISASVRGEELHTGDPRSQRAGASDEEAE